MKKWLIAPIALALVVAACGGADPTATPAPTATPVVAPTAAAPVVAPTATSVVAPPTATATTAAPTATPVPAPTAVPTAPPKPVTPMGTLNIARARIGTGGYVPWLTRGTAKNYLPYFDRLFNMQQDGVTVVPGLVERWEFPSDGLSISFFVRKGVEFHNGWGEFTAEDVKYTIDNVLGPDSRASGGLLKTTMDRIEVAGTYELTMFLKSPFGADIPALMTLNAIVSKKYVEGVGEEEANQKESFTGPFRVVDEKDGEFIRLEALDKHWRVIPEWKVLDVREVPEEATRVALLTRGEADIIESTHTIANALEKDGFRHVLFRSSHNMAFPMYGQWMPPHETYEPFLNIKVREAMNLAINREEIAKAIYYGYAQPTGTLTWYPWSHKYEPRPYDPERAKQLLKEAGYPNGFKVDLWILQWAQGPTEQPEVAEAVAGYWEAIGLEVPISTFSIREVFGNIVQRKVKGATWPQPTTIIVPWFRNAFIYYDRQGFTGPFYEHPDVEVILEELRGAGTEELRNKLMEDITKHVYDNYNVVPVVTADERLMISDRIGEWPTIRFYANKWANYEYITHNPPLGTFRMPGIL